MKWKKSWTHGATVDERSFSTESAGRDGVLNTTAGRQRKILSMRPTLFAISMPSSPMHRKRALPNLSHEDTILRRGVLSRTDSFFTYFSLFFSIFLD